MTDEEEITKNIQGGEYLYNQWLGRKQDKSFYDNSMDVIQATFALRDKKLYEYALTVLRREVLLHIEGNEVVSIEAVKAELLVLVNRLDYIDRKLTMMK
jgi:hypothetical protein